MHQTLEYGDGAMPKMGDVVIFRIPELNLDHGMEQNFPHGAQARLAATQDHEGLVEVSPYDWHFELRQALDPKSRKVLGDVGWFNSRGNQVEKAPDKFTYGQEIVQEKPGRWHGEDVIIRTTIKPVLRMPVFPHVLGLVERYSSKLN